MSKNTTARKGSVANDRMPRIWIIYSSEDRSAAKECYRQLKEWRFDCRMDVTHILPGQKWKREIISNIAAADAVLILLSQKCLMKEGVFQWEVRRAVERSKKQQDDSIFLVPLRLESCAMPVELERLQWVDWFNVNDPLFALVPTLGRICFEVNRPWRPLKSNDDNAAEEQGIPIHCPRKPAKPRKPRSVRAVAGNRAEQEDLVVC